MEAGGAGLKQVFKAKLCPDTVHGRAPPLPFRCAANIYVKGRVTMDDLRTQNYERLLDRAWRAAYDALEAAENQRRHIHVRKLKHVCVVIGEAQSDIQETRDRVMRRTTRNGTDGPAGSVASFHD
jgi:hypothetical protein